MIKDTALAILLACILLISAGCGNNGADLPDEDAVAIDIANKSDDIIVSYALFYGTGLDEWGEDLLGDEVIEPGETVSFVMPQGVYTVILMTYEYFVVDIARDIAENYRLEFGHDHLHSILFSNQTETDIALLYLSPAESTDWGEDLLGREVIPSGVSRFIFVEAGTYDILAINIEQERALEEYDVEIDSDKVIEIVPVE